MNLQDTSLEAYYTRVLPVLGERQHQVYEVFMRAHHSMTNMEVANILGWSINRVTPRVLELRELGLLEFAERRRCRITGNNAMSWRKKL